MSQTLRKVPIKSLKQGPIRHQTLSKALLTRIQQIYSAIGPYCGCPDLETWADGFRRDTHPENEVDLWESTSRAFTQFTQIRSLSPQAYREVFKTLVMGMTCDAETIMKHLLSLNHISPHEARDLIRIQARIYDEIRWDRLTAN